MTEKLITIETVMERTHLGRTKIYAMIRKGEFPKPAKLGGASRWRESVLEQWIASTSPAD